jgi:hypothetical protein
VDNNCVSDFVMHFALYKNGWFHASDLNSVL